MPKLRAIKRPPPAKKPLVVLVDDDPALLSLLRRWIEHDPGLQIVTATNGLEAIALIRDLGGCQLVVADYRMPGMNGLTLLRAVKHKWPRCRRILYTGHADSELVLESASVAHRVLTKQMDTTLVRNAISREART